MRRARFSAQARNELIHETLYYEQAREGTGKRFRLAVEAATARALAFPKSGKPAPAETRRILVRGFPFSVVYEEVLDGIFIHAVASARRRPDYWVERVTKRG